MTHDAALLRAKLHKNMRNVGRTNGTACPSTKSNTDPLLHELFIASELEAYWKTRHAQAKADAHAIINDDLVRAVDSVIKLNAGTSFIGASGDAYTLTVDISKPARRLDAKKLRNYMTTNLGIDPDKVADAFDACSVSNAPAKKLRVSSN